MDAGGFVDGWLTVPEVTPEGAVVLARTDDYVIDMQPMIFNWRLHVARAEEYGQFYVHGYCYFGRGDAPRLAALAAAAVWHDPLTTEPAGFDKQAY